MQFSALLMLLLGVVTVSAAPPPLAFGPDFVEVTTNNTLRRRYRVWGDWEKNLAAYLAEARANATARGTPGRKLTMGCVFLKDAHITSNKVKGSDGQPLTAAYTTPAKFVAAMQEHGMKDYTDFMFAFSGGELEVDWVVATVEGLRWQTDNTEWGCQPKAVGEQVTKALEKYKDAGVCMWMFCAGRPETLNGGPKQKIGAPPLGISHTQWRLHGGYSLVMSAPDVGVMVHEFNHRYLDNLESIEGIKLTMFHGLANLGYEGDDCGYPNLLNTYSSVYRYIIRRDMWRRFTVTGTNHTSHEPFTGKAYAWADVQADCWFKLPELHDQELATLTGLKTFHMDAPLKATYRLFTVAPAERAQIRSLYVEKSSESDTQLNNLLSLHTESCAVLATPTGQWLFVRPDLADLYAVGRESYGYVLEGIRPLVVFKAPADAPLPANELGYFRPVAKSEKRCYNQDR